MSTVVISESLLVKYDAGKDKVRREGHCRMCLRAAAEVEDLPRRPDAVRLMTRHHLVPCHWYRQNPEWRDLRDCDANIVPLCRSCHDLVELSEWNGGRDHRRLLRRVMTQAEIVFVIQMRGIEWLEERYPLR